MALSDSGDFQGYLERKPQSKFLPKLKMWCTLSDKDFTFIKDKQRQSEGRTIDINSVQSVRKVICKKAKEFEVVTKQKTYTFVAATTELCDSWVRRLEAMLLQSKPLSGNESKDNIEESIPTQQSVLTTEEPDSIITEIDRSSSQYDQLENVIVTDPNKESSHSHPDVTAIQQLSVCENSSDATPEIPSNSIDSSEQVSVLEKESISFPSGYSQNEMSCSTNKSDSQISSPEVSTVNPSQDDANVEPVYSVVDKSKQSSDRNKPSNRTSENVEVKEILFSGLNCDENLEGLKDTETSVEVTREVVASQSFGQSFLSVGDGEYASVDEYDDKHVSTVVEDNMVSPPRKHDYNLIEDDIDNKTGSINSTVLAEPFSTSTHPNHTSDKRQQLTPLRNLPVQIDSELDDAYEEISAVKAVVTEVTHSTKDSQLDAPLCIENEKDVLKQPLLPQTDIQIIDTRYQVYDEIEESHPNEDTLTILHASTSGETEAIQSIQSEAKGEGAYDEVEVCGRNNIGTMKDSLKEGQIWYRDTYNKISEGDYEDISLPNKTRDNKSSDVEKGKVPQNNLYENGSCVVDTENQNRASDDEPVLLRRQSQTVVQTVPEVERRSDKTKPQTERKHNDMLQTKTCPVESNKHVVLSDKQPEIDELQPMAALKVFLGQHPSRVQLHVNERGSCGVKQLKDFLSSLK